MHGTEHYEPRREYASADDVANGGSLAAAIAAERDGVTHAFGRDARAWRGVLAEARGAQAADEATARRRLPLETLAFCAAVLSLMARETPASEPDQFTGLYLAQRVHLGRCLTTAEVERLRDASRAIWAARLTTTTKVA